MVSLRHVRHRSAEAAEGVSEGSESAHNGAGMKCLVERQAWHTSTAVYASVHHQIDGTDGGGGGRAGGRGGTGEARQRAYATVPARCCCARLPRRHLLSPPPMSR